MDAHAVWNRRVPTAALNRFLAQASEAHPPPAVRGRRVRLDYITQPKSRPPTFVLFSSRASSLPETYRRYLINGLREAFALPGTPIRLTLRAKVNPLCRPKAPLMERPISRTERKARRGAARGRLRLHLRDRPLGHARHRHCHSGAAEARGRFCRRRHRRGGEDFRSLRHRMGADAISVLAVSRRAVRQLRPARR